jgi:hypothetical protein
MILIPLLFSVPALLPLATGMADDQEAREEGRFRHGLRYMVAASCPQYSIEEAVVSCYHCCSPVAYH